MSSSSHTPRSVVVASCAAGVACVIGLVGLVGGWAGVGAAVSWVEGLPRMVPLASAVMVVTGLGVIALALGNRRAALASALSSAALLVFVAVVRSLQLEIGGPLLLPPELRTAGSLGVPVWSTAFLMALVVAALLLVLVHQVVVAQVLAVVAALVSYMSIVAYVFGDSTDIIVGSDFPQTRTALPSAAAVLLTSVAMVVAVPDRGVWSWLNTPGAGRAILRRILVLLVVVPIVVVGVVRATDLQSRLGSPRSDAVTVTLIVLLLLGAAFGAVREIDRLSAEAQLREVTEQVALASAADARRSEQIAALAAGLAAASSIAEVSDALVADGAASMGASWVGLATLDPLRPVLSVVRSSTGNGIVQDDVEVALDQPLPMVDALIEQEPVWLHDRAEIARRYPAAMPEVEANGLSMLLSAPLCASDGEAIGVLGVGWAEGGWLDDSLHSVVSTVSDLCAQTLERARLSDAEHALVSGLQERLVGPPPALSNLDVQVRYRPAANVGMGGDWYEIVTSPDGQVTVILGDVSGHGVEAVADMAQARTVIGSLVRQGLPLGNILYQVDDLLGRDEMIMATVMLVRIDPVTGVVRHTCAGHPPVALRRPDGGVCLLDGGRQALLGARVELGPVEPGIIELEPESILVVYSDGLVERRGEDLEIGFARLLATLGEAPAHSASAVADHLEREMLGGEGGVDDTAMVVIRLSDPATGEDSVPV